MGGSPSPKHRRRALYTLKRERLIELSDHYNLDVGDRRIVDNHVDGLVRAHRVDFAELLGLLTRAELKAMCAALGLDDSGREKAVLMARLLGQAPAERQPSLPAPPDLPVPKPAHAAPPPAPLPAGLAADALAPVTIVQPATAQRPTTASVLQVLPKARLLDLARDAGLQLPPTATKEAQIEQILGANLIRFRELLRALGRDELKAACRAHGLDEGGRARHVLAERLLKAHGSAETAAPPPLFKAREIPRYAPRTGDIVQVRHRQWLVEEVVPPPEEGHATRVRMVCLDDDNAGRVLEVLWELELGAKVLQPETHGLGTVTRIDPPRHFGAYLHALKWSSVTATDAKLFQAPFRAGIELHDYQLTPLKKALSLPRANLFIADDVGLGKTIEAGLVLQELLLRQRIELVVIICPASVCLQWRDEMQKRFGLHFEVMSRHFIARRRQERGFGVNPWSTHNRFIVAHPIVRRPEYRDPLLQHIGERAKKSLLILDEAHVAAPASASKYAIDSRTTRVIRDIAPRFENRLFLSATPHNGHSNSFSALLEILDPQRFTRGVRIESGAQLEPVMVRRLKEDLREIGVGSFPLRKLVQIGLKHDGKIWHSRELVWDPSKRNHSEGHKSSFGAQFPAELVLLSPR